MTPRFFSLVDDKAGEERRLQNKRTPLEGELHMKRPAAPNSHHPIAPILTGLFLSNYTQTTPESLSCTPQARTYTQWTQQQYLLVQGQVAMAIEVAEAVDPEEDVEWLSMIRERQGKDNPSLTGEDDVVAEVEIEGRSEGKLGRTQ
jgi:hypothetical protein